MDKNYESVYHDEEEHNWWFVARRDMLYKFLDKYKVTKDAKILDIGCAGGTLLVEMKEMGYTNLVALDYSEDAIALVKKKGIEQAYVMDGHYPDFEENSFDLIISSDSLEHLEHDTIALKNWHKVLKPGGLAFVLVPAFNFLWTAHDDVNYHFRRYTVADLNKKSKDVGFSVVYSGYNYVLLFIPTAMVRSMIRLVKGKHRKVETVDEGQILMLPKWVNSMLVGIQKVENSLSKYIRFPFGVSAYTIISK